MIPSTETCFKLMNDYRMPPHIRQHSIMVEKIAVLLAGSLVQAGMILSLEKVQAGALMHDIAKSICIESGGDHCAKGKEICLLNGLDEIADIVGEHVRIRNHRLEGPVSEKEIVYYADKRVNHDKVVSLEERLGYLIQRYGQGMEGLQKAIRDNFEICRGVETKIFSRLGYSPEDLSEMVRRR